jgi:hypothetical protein
MAATAQRLARENLPLQEFPQTSDRLAAMSQNLYELIRGRQLAVYPDTAMRLAATRCVAVESSRGLRIDKVKQSHKIDVMVALAMACFAAVQGGNQYGYDFQYKGWQPGYIDPDAKPTPPEQPSSANKRLNDLYRGLAGFGPSPPPATIPALPPRSKNPIWEW